ncbi:MAG TPA: NAD(P)/FAD-dependent oxidoreductase [Thermoanaerobaculia bacterium]|nr:NAD(P)/FAD-dependent oxidoreductase [Thermoanaerobaculia bacterium]
MRKSRYDAVVVGSGPNGFAAAIELARSGLSVLIVEAAGTAGGGARTEQVTLEGFHHDVCSAIHPMSLVSPFLESLPLQEHGLEWAWSPAAVAHPLDGGAAAAIAGSLEATAESLGADGAAYRRLMAPLVRHAHDLFAEILRPATHLPRHPFVLARFGLAGLRSAESIVKRFRTPAARALFGGCAAHSFLPLEAAGSAAFGLALAVAAHAVGWPAAKGGSFEIIRAMQAYFESLGGEVVTNHPVRTMRDVPEARAVLFDVTPRQLAGIAAEQLPSRYVRRLHRFLYGPGVFKIDWALDGPIPWIAEAPHRAATVHAGGTFEEIAAHERRTWKGVAGEHPFVLVAQQSMFDATRAPAGKHTGWAYCHVPNGSTEDMTERIERQIERFAPGFSGLILARRTLNTAQYERHNANFVGGDIGGGANVLSQFLTRPFLTLDPYATPNDRIYLCSSSTPPGGGVHGMCGFWAARSALRRSFRRR